MGSAQHGVAALQGGGGGEGADLGAEGADIGGGGVQAGAESQADRAQVAGELALAGGDDHPGVRQDGSTAHSIEGVLFAAQPMGDGVA